MKPLKARISLTLDEDLVNRLKDLADDDDRSLSQYINLILKEHVRKMDSDTADTESN